jgi:hypothetical protein
VELLHGGVCGAELEKREQSSPKHPLSHFLFLSRKIQVQAIQHETSQVAEEKLHADTNLTN